MSHYSRFWLPSENFFKFFYEIVNQIVHNQAKNEGFYAEDNQQKTQQVVLKQEQAQDLQDFAQWKTDQERIGTGLICCTTDRLETLHIIL